MKGLRVRRQYGFHMMRGRGRVLESCPHLAQTVVSVIGDGGRRGRLRLPGRGRSPA